MYVNEAPQGITGSYVVYLLVSETPIHTNTDVTDELTIQYSVFADKYADLLNEAVKAMITEVKEPHDQYILKDGKIGYKV